MTLGRDGQTFSVWVPKSVKVNGQICPRANQRFVSSTENIGEEQKRSSRPQMFYKRRPYADQRDFCYGFAVD